MSKPTVRIYNCETGETIDREMNDAEFAQYKIEQAKYQAEKAKADAKESQRQALLARLGITEAEAQLLLGGN